MGTWGVSAIAAVAFAFAFGARAAEGAAIVDGRPPASRQFRRVSPAGGGGG